MSQDQLLRALYAIAQQQGRDPNELLAELLRSQLPAQRQLPAPSYPARTEVLPPAPRPQLNLPQRYAGVPSPQSESDIEALARWLEAESGPTGVFGEGGMSAGGVFGEAPVATAGHDPTADLRSAQMALARLAPELIRALSRPPPPQYPQHSQYPPPAPVRMITQTSVTYYEGPAPPQPVQTPSFPRWGRR